MYLYNKDTRTITYTDFINKELVLFSNADNERSIPSMADGKIFFIFFGGVGLPLVLGDISILSKLCNVEKILNTRLSPDYLDISRRHDMTQNIVNYENLIMIHWPKMLICIALNQFTSWCPNIYLSWTCTRRQARASLQPKNRSKFYHQKSIFRLGDISCYRRYFIDDNRLTFKSNTAHH